MPKITINEMDLTNPGQLNVDSNVVYVPGLAKYLPLDFNPMRPKIYTSLVDFQKDFGDKVPTIGLDQLQGTLPGFDTYFRYDTGYIYAVELLRLGMPVLYDCLLEASTNKTNNGKNLEVKIPANADPYMYSNIIANLENHIQNKALQDKGLYNIKFVSNGGYVYKSQGSADTTNVWVRDIAIARQDCCALLDFKYNTSYDNINSAIESGNTIPDLPANDDNAKYSAAFFPWGTYTPTCVQNYQRRDNNGDPTLENGAYTYYPELVELPGSFAYLMAAATALKAGANSWSAMAGATRGAIPFLQSLKEELTEDQANSLQRRDRVSINPILTINPFGRIVWGNRTLYNNALKGNLTASSFLNIRNLISDVKKTVFTACRQMTFEQNSAILWIKFKSLITPTLEKMVSGSGLGGYELRKVVSKEKAKLVAKVRLFAIEAVEDFDITIELADDTATVTE